MSLAEVLKLIHVVAVIVWLGGAFLLIVLFGLTARSGDEATVVGLTKAGEKLGLAVFNPAGIITLIAGVWLAIEADFDFSEAWISIGFLGVILGAALGMAFYPKALRRLQAGITDGGLEGAESIAALRRMRTIQMAEFAFLLVVVWAMVVKPGA